MQRLLQAATWPLRALVRLVAREASAAWHENPSSGLHFHFFGDGTRVESGYIDDLLVAASKRGYGLRPNHSGAARLVEEEPPCGSGSHRKEA